MSLVEEPSMYLILSSIILSKQSKEESQILFTVIVNGNTFV